MVPKKVFFVESNKLTSSHLTRQVGEVTDGCGFKIPAFVTGRGDGQDLSMGRRGRSQDSSWS
jgi:hypothetical protein